MKEKRFIKKSIYPGGNEALKKFIKTHLKYPKEALENKIEGDVFLRFKVNPLGQVFDVHIINGIGYGCDEEAVRLIKTLKYTELLNRKINVTTNKIIAIKCRLPKNHNKLNVNYEITP